MEASRLLHGLIADVVFRVLVVINFVTGSEALVQQLPPPLAVDLQPGEDPILRGFLPEDLTHAVESAARRGPLRRLDGRRDGRDSIAHRRFPGLLPL